MSNEAKHTTDRLYSEDFEAFEQLKKFIRADRARLAAEKKELVAALQSLVDDNETMNWDAHKSRESTLKRIIALLAKHKDEIVTEPSLAEQERMGASMKKVSWVVQVGTAKVLYGPFKTPEDAAKFLAEQFNDSADVAIKRVFSL
jgi:Skp family chaperone for outer membrane proteins